MPKQTESDYGADDAAQRLRQMLRAAFLRRSAPKDENPVRNAKPRTARKSKDNGKPKRT